VECRQSIVSISTDHQGAFSSPLPSLPCPPPSHLLSTTLPPPVSHPPSPVPRAKPAAHCHSEMYVPPTPTDEAGLCSGGFAFFKFAPFIPPYSTLYHPLHIFLTHQQFLYPSQPHVPSFVCLLLGCFFCLFVCFF
jgi:hypothetical protein